jgi:hypothetical protein
MGIGPHPGSFPATVQSVASGFVTFKADPKDLEYLKKQVGKAGTLEWTPNSYSPDAGSKVSSAS